MDVEMSINGHDIREWGMTTLKGTLANLMKPTQMKALTTNDSRSINGSRALLVNRRVDKRNVSLLFHIQSLTDMDLVRTIENLVSFLIDGKDGSGENEVFVRRTDKTYRLVYMGCDTYATMNRGRATISLQFTELNPTNRT